MSVTPEGTALMTGKKLVFSLFVKSDIDFHNSLSYTLLNYSSMNMLLKDTVYATFCGWVNKNYELESKESSSRRLFSSQLGKCVWGFGTLVWRWSSSIKRGRRGRLFAKIQKPTANSLETVRDKMRKVEPASCPRLFDEFIFPCRHYRPTQRTESALQGKSKPFIDLIGYIYCLKK